MKQRNDATYYRDRAEQERTLAARAIRPEVRRVHLELASHYVQRIEQSAQIAPQA